MRPFGPTFGHTPPASTGSSTSQTRMLWRHLLSSGPPIAARWRLATCPASGLQDQRSEGLAETIGNVLCSWQREHAPTPSQHSTHEGERITSQGMWI